MVNAMVPETKNINIQTEMPTVQKQSNVASIRIDPPVIDLPHITPPTSYTINDEKKWIIDKLYRN